MKDINKVFVMRGDKSFVEGLSKEQTLAAIKNAVEQGEIKEVDAGFVTTIKEMNGNRPLKFWVGSQAQFNALSKIENDCLYVINDDTTLNEIENVVTQIDTNTTNINSLLTGDTNILWSIRRDMSDDSPIEVGKYQMTADETIQLGGKISEQRHGVIFVFQPFIIDTKHTNQGNPQNYGFQYCFVPKMHTQYFNGKGMAFNLSNKLNHIATKYIYISDNYIKGNAQNTNSGTTNGITYDNSYFILTRVLGV